MSIHVTCEGCGKVLSVPDGAEGRKIQCARCGKKMRVPAQAPQAEAEAEAAPPPAAPAPPAPPPTAAPASEVAPDKDAFFRALAAEAARDQGEAAAAKAPKADAESELVPEPEASLRGKSAATKELRIKAGADKTGYDVADDAAPPQKTPQPPGRDMQRRSLGKLIVVALGLLLVIGITISIVVGLSGNKPTTTVSEAPIVNNPAVAPQPVAPPPSPAPALPAALKEAAQALAADALVEVEVVAAAADAKPTMPILTPAGDLLLDVTGVQIHDKDNTSAGMQEMQSAIRPAVYESVAAKLREKGLAPVEAEPSAATSKPGESHSRLKVFIHTTPAWAGFSFRERGAPPEINDDRPSQPGQLIMPSRQPSRPPSAPARRGGGRRIQATLPAAAQAPPGNPARFWARLLSSGLTIDARFFNSERGAQEWFAVPDDDIRADQLPCGLRIWIVRVAWEVGDRTHDLTGRAPETGIPVPFRRPKRIREIQLTGQKGADRTCVISGFCQYDDLDPNGGAAAAGGLVADLLAAPEADWRTLWAGRAGRDAIAAACRNVLRLDGGPDIVAILAAHPDRLPQSSAEALASVLKEEDCRPEWARAFLAVRGPCGDAALICLARQATEEDLKDFIQWVATPADRSPESVQAACCALIDLGRPGPEVNALLDARVVKGFSEVRSPRACLVFPPQTAQRVLDWLIRNGTLSQRIGAAAAVVEGNINELQDRVLASISQPLGSDPETFYTLCKGLGKAQSPLAFGILSSVAKRQLAKTDAGDRFLPPEAFSDAGAPLPEGQYSRTVAALVCAGLAQYDKFEAGKALVELIQSPGPATRRSAIETLMALDDVDVAKEIQARYKFLNTHPRNAYERQEWELLNPAKNKLCRYAVPLDVAESLMKDSSNAKEVIAFCDRVITEKPSPTLVKQVTEMKLAAERQQLDRLDAENALKDNSRAKEVTEICDEIIKANLDPTLVERAQDMKRQAEKAPAPPAPSTGTLP